MTVRITCINKDNGNHENPYVSITNLGWLEESTGKRGRSTRLEMYNFIKDGNYAYVVDPKDSSKAYLETRVSAAGTKYVRTKPDDTRRDNLLSLPEC